MRQQLQTPPAGLYALKPWYAHHLQPIVADLDRRGIRPNTVTLTGVGFAGLAGLLLAVLPSGPVAGVLVAVLLALRLACANMDGSLARLRPADLCGGIANELGDRGADLAMLAGFIPVIGWRSGVVMLAATLPSWISLVVSAHGGTRANTGPMGKTERCAAVVVAAATGWIPSVALLIVVGSCVTVAVRLAAGRRAVVNEAAR